MSLPRCPDNWEYKDVTGYEPILKTNAKSVLMQLHSGLDARLACIDTRKTHRHLFDRLTPSGFSYFAGNYRGEDFPCLKPYAVKVDGDPRVGFPPHVVPGTMTTELAPLITAGLAALDAGNRLPDAQVSPGTKLQMIVAFAANVFELFLRIHPYANGNGHIGRFIVTAVLGRYGYWLRRWPIEPRPKDPPYSTFIARHRDGDREPLESFILDCLTP